MTTTAIKVPKIRCEGCAATITRALGALPGIAASRVEIAVKEVHVEYDPAQVDEGRIHRALREAGFPPAT
ncbi:MAG: heavy-metal-associated domain-containing protein [Candidatus Rokubacteria bacterium]|nr:heavy-metal-associated domain-containing protein [Candidatus Rokubacteria bacterium]